MEAGLTVNGRTRDLEDVGGPRDAVTASAQSSASEGRDSR
jgi:hypothetical protein